MPSLSKNDQALESKPFFVFWGGTFWLVEDGRKEGGKYIEPKLHEIARRVISARVIT